MSTNEDLGRLVTFLEDFRNILQHFVEDYLENPSNTAIENGLWDKELTLLFQNTFPAVNRAVIISIDRLKQADDDLIRKLDDHGLVGDSLKLKMHIFNFHKKDVLDIIEHDKKKIPKPSFVERLKKPFRRFLNCADIVLESLSDCIPGLGIALEFKKTLEHITE